MDDLTTNVLSFEQRNIWAGLELSDIEFVEYNETTQSSNIDFHQLIREQLTYYLESESQRAKYQRRAREIREYRKSLEAVDIKNEVETAKILDVLKACAVELKELQKYTEESERLLRGFTSHYYDAIKTTHTIDTKFDSDSPSKSLELFLNDDAQTLITATIDCISTDDEKCSVCERNNKDVKYVGDCQSITTPCTCTKDPLPVCSDCLFERALRQSKENFEQNLRSEELTITCIVSCPHCFGNLCPYGFRVKKFAPVTDEKILYEVFCKQDYSSIDSFEKAAPIVKSGMRACLHTLRLIERLLKPSRLPMKRVKTEKSGRLRDKKGRKKKKPQCSNCLMEGHYKPKCPLPPNDNALKSPLPRRSHADDQQITAEQLQIAIEEHSISKLSSL